MSLLASDKTRERAWLAALAALMIAQMWMSDLRLSVTSDEIDHLQAGYRYVTCHDFGWNPEHPPLVKMVAAVPLLFMHINDPIGGACGLPDNRGIDFRAGHDFVFANREAVLTAARFATSIFAVGLLIVCWLLAKKLFGRTVAMVAAILIAFEPTILGHGALVTTDVAAAFGFVLAIYATYCYLEKPDWRHAGLLGTSVGLALCLKHSTVLLAIIIPLILMADVLWTRRTERSLRVVKHAVALVIVPLFAVAGVWASYGFHYSGRPGDSAIWPLEKQWEQVHGFVPTKLIPELTAYRVLPEAYLVGLRDVTTVSELGRPGFLLGHSYFGGRWAYFPVGALIKLTLPFLLLLLVSAFAFGLWRSHLRELCFLAFPVAVVLAFALASGINIGFRHVLPIIPFLAIFGAAGAWSLLGTHRWRKYALAPLLLIHAGSSLHSFPNYLSYGNEAWGGPANTYKYLADSNVDWGQAQKIAREYIARARPEACFFLQAYNERSSDYGIPCGSITEMEDEIPPETFTGTLIVSSSVVDGILPFDGGVRAGRIFRHLTPKTKLGGSALLVYEGTFDLRPLVSATLLRRNVDPSFSPQEKMARARWAAEIDPNDPDAYMIMCSWSKRFGDVAAAATECNTGLRLILSDQESSEHIRQRAFAYISGLGIPIDRENRTQSGANMIHPPAPLR
jgi:hypothetical protein